MAEASVSWSIDRKCEWGVLRTRDVGWFLGEFGVSDADVVDVRASLELPPPPVLGLA